MVVLDTHAWLWWVDGEARLSRPARDAIAGAGGIGVPAICCWEVAMLVVKRRIDLGRAPRTWIRQALARPGTVALPLSPKIAVEAALLAAEEFAGDPADRLIYATARDAGAPLVTRDAAIRDFDPRGTVW